MHLNTTIQCFYFLKSGLGYELSFVLLSPSSS